MVGFTILCLFELSLSCSFLILGGDVLRHLLVSIERPLVDAIAWSNGVDVPHVVLDQQLLCILGMPSEGLHGSNQLASQEVVIDADQVLLASYNDVLAIR